MKGLRHSVLAKSRAPKQARERDERLAETFARVSGRGLGFAVKLPLIFFFIFSFSRRHCVQVFPPPIYTFS
jgi:hypothetical protein